MTYYDPIDCPRKTCMICRGRMSLDAFPLDASRKDGRYPICTVCRHDYRLCPRWKPDERDCAICGEAFAPRRWDQMTCGAECSYVWQNEKLGRASWKHTSAWCWLDDLFWGLWLVSAGNNREMDQGFELMREATAAAQMSTIQARKAGQRTLFEVTG